MSYYDFKYFITDVDNYTIVSKINFQMIITHVPITVRRTAYSATTV